MQRSLVRQPQFFPGQMGVPGSDVPLGLRVAGGNVFYVGTTVGSVVANDNNDGTDPLNPKASLAAAYAKCTSGQGDTIVVLPGTYQPAAALTIAKDDLKVIGWDWITGRAPGGCVVDGQGAIHLFAVEADNVEFAGIAFANGDGAGFDIIAAAAAADALGLYVHDCALKVGRYGLSLGGTGTLSDFLVENCMIWMEDDTAANAGILLTKVATGLVRNCFLAMASANGVYGVSCPNVASDRVMVADNLFDVGANDTGIYRAGTTVNVGMARNLFVGGGTTITQLADGGTHGVNNYVADAAGGALIDPTT